jgi:ribonuclease HII
MPPDFLRETRLGRSVAGIDEAGRGPWAGPVVAAAVILDPALVPPGIDDSKRLSGRRREMLLEAILASARVGVGRASVGEIDAMNVSQATFLAMRRAVAALPARPASALVDGTFVPPGLPCPAEAVTGGDGRCLSIAAASIVAKVTRDRIMARLAAAWPGYGWERNAGYGTAEHRAALLRLGVTPHHRRSFRPIHNMLCEETSITH